MTSWKWVVVVIVVVIKLEVTSASLDHTLQANGGRRDLASIKDKRDGNTNFTFHCSPSGPCVPCQYSEKNDEKYRCSETGYRIPLKCVEIKDVKNENDDKKTHERRSVAEIVPQTKDPSGLWSDATLNRILLESKSTSDGKSQAYITYRSCIQQVSEEKLSVIGFESIVFCLLLVSGSAVYFRKRRSAVMPGVATGRTQTNSRF